MKTVVRTTGAPKTKEGVCYKIGIDAGSKTIKVVVIDENDQMISSSYHRHRTDIKETLAATVHDLFWQFGDIECTVGVTGSAGIGIAEMVGLPFYQEVIATTHAARFEYPQADAIIELGGEDAKVIYLTGGLEQRMNASCAGGTGGFIDSMSHRLGIRSARISNAALGAMRTYPIASRCAVFAETDIRPLMNAGASTSDLAASVLDAVVRQTLGGLACGRPIEGTVLFLGGPLEHIPELTRQFRRALNLTRETGIKPENAHLFTACGAALLAAADHERGLEGHAAIRLSELDKCISNLQESDDGLPRLAPLFEDEQETSKFRARHLASALKRASMGIVEGPLYLGIDAGSTGTKIVVINREGQLVYDAYQKVEGDTLTSAQKLLGGFYDTLPRMAHHNREAYIAQSCVTGYGEDMLRSLLHIDSGMVETLAHLRGAQFVCPDVSFILDIGGQDMKALWVKDGRIENAVLNEACSSGCGAFIEGTAAGLHMTQFNFADAAVSAKSPVDLGIKCTVFMNSRVRHAQKMGVPKADIAAGIAYSVVKNALFKIIGMQQLDSLGDHIVVQGGTFESDAVLRAFELISGRNVIRPDKPRIMGALGAALTARDKAIALEMRFSAEHGPDENYTVRSSMLSKDECAALEPKRSTIVCPGCANSCTVSIISVGDGAHHASGNRCSRAEYFVSKKLAAPRGSTLYSASKRHTSPAATADEIAAAAASAEAQATNKDGHRIRVPNVVELEQKLIARYVSTDKGSADVEEPPAGRAAVRVGIVNAINDYDHLPFWHTLFAQLGFTTLVADNATMRSSAVSRKAMASIPSESVCNPAKISHLRAYDLIRQGATHLLMPAHERGNLCAVSCRYPDALRDSIPEVRDGKVQLVDFDTEARHPEGFFRSENDLYALYKMVNSLAGNDRISVDEFRSAIMRAMDEQLSFEDRIEQGNRAALKWMERTGNRGMVLAGRPYHADPEALHGIDDVVASLGVAVINPLRLRNVAGDPQHEQPKPDVLMNMRAFMQSSQCAPVIWTPSKHYTRLAKIVANNPKLDLVILHAFGCLYDEVSIREAKEVLEAAGKPYTALKVDDLTDTAHIRIRLRTLSEALTAPKLADIEKDAPLKADYSDRASNASEPTHMSALGANSNGHFTIEELYPFDQRMPGRPLLEAGINQYDLDIAQQRILSDTCFVVRAIAGRMVHTIEENGLNNVDNGAVFEMPQVCQGCLLNALPTLVRAATGVTPLLKWTNKLPQAWIDQVRASENAYPPARRGFDLGAFPADGEADETAEAATIDTDDRPVIGLVGCPLLVFDPFMNDELVSFIESQGFRAVMPQPQFTLVENVRYLTQLNEFSRIGVKHIIYLQSFGCLKGHVWSRGSSQGLRRKFPDLTITVIDYDSDASALNRENRVRLALEAARIDAEEG